MVSHIDSCNLMWWTGAMWCHKMSHNVTSHDITWYHVASCDMWHCVMSHDVMWCHMVSHDVTWCQTISHDVTWCHIEKVCRRAKLLSIQHHTQRYQTPVLFGGIVELAHKQGMFIQEHKQWRCVAAITPNHDGLIKTCSKRCFQHDSMCVCMLCVESQSTAQPYMILLSEALVVASMQLGHIHPKLADFDWTTLHHFQ